MSLLALVLHIFSAIKDKYKVYKSLPPQIRSFLTQLTVARLMKYLSVNNIWQLQKAMASIFHNDETIVTEKDSGFWYDKYHGYQFSNKDKLSRLERVFPQSVTILNHPLFAYLALPQIKRKSYAIKERMKFCHPVFEYHDALDARTGMSIFETDLDGIDSFGLIVSYMQTQSLESLRLLTVSRNLLLSDEALFLNASLIRPSFRNLLDEVKSIRFEKEINHMFDSHLK